MSINNQNTYLNIEDAHLRLRTGNVYAQGITIGGITVDPSHGLQRVSDTGNVTTTTLQFDNATTAFTTTANVTVGRDLTVTGNALVSSNLTVTGNAVTENLLVSNNLTVTGNTFYTNPAAVLVDSNVVTEYTGPHDRPLRKYPEVAMTQNDESATSGYVASASSSLTGNPTYLAFDGSASTHWHTQFPYYTESEGVYDPGNAPGGAGTYSGTLPSHELVSGYAGEYITLSLPNKIKMSKISINTRYDGNLNLDQTQSAEVIVVVGSHDGSTWEFVDTHTVGKYPDDNTIPYTFNVNTSTYYEHVGLICTNTGPTDSVYNTAWSISKLAFYGYEEGSGSLDTTLKSVYNVPATTGTQLEVYYDAKDLATMPSTVTDLAGGDQDGSVSSVTLDITDGIESFNFDGTLNNAITTTLPSTFVDNQVHSVAFWFYYTSTKAVIYPFHIGTQGTNDSIGLWIGDGTDSSGSYLTYFFYGNDCTITSHNPLVVGTWNHIALVHNGTDLERKLYINNTQIEFDTNSNNGPLSLPASSTLHIGRSSYYSSGDATIKMANFRLYSKALNADQVKELYDYQKDYFLGSKSQVTLYKGHLGVGVTEPSGQLELAGDERIQEYPPRAMTGYETLVEGHGVFCASASSYYNYITHLPWQAFTPASTTIVDGWNSGDNSTGTDLGYYAETSSGEATSAAALFEGTRGEWVQLKCPYPIIVKKFAITGRSNGVYGGSPEDQPKSGILYGSNDGNNWDILANFSGLTYGGASGGSGTTGGTELVEVNATKGYTRLVLQATARVTNYGTDDWINIGQLQYFGTPGPTTLDKGSLSLGRSLDVPRISRYDVDTETPRPEKLVVDFDTTVNSTPTDISGKGNHGAFYNGASYSPADKAFTFVGSSSTGVDSSDKIQSTYDWGSTAPAHTFSVWFKRTANLADWEWICSFGQANNTGGNPGILISGDTYSGGANLISFDTFNDQVITTYAVPLDVWTHVVATFNAASTAWSPDNCKIYVNGVLTPGTNASVGNLNVVGNEITLGATHEGKRGFTGQISNFKLYSVALEPSEVKKLYNLGRTGRSMVISDTAVGIGKVPEAQLDVRGNLRVGGTIQFPLIISHRFMNVGDTTVTSGNYIPFNGVIYENPPGIHNGNYFTCPVKGIYECHADMLVDNGGNYDGNHEWYKNNAALSPRRRGYGQQSDANFHNQATSHYYIECDAGDLLSLKGVSTVVWYGSNTYSHTHMSIRLITAT